MESLEEILKVVGGLIFGAIYLFGNQIFKSKDEDTPGPSTLPRESAGSDDDAARQRQIQEAIRRKIMQRRQATATPTSSEPVSAHREQHKQVVERHKETHQRAPHVEPTPEASEVDDRFSWNTSDNVYEEQMQARLEQIEATKRRAEALRRQASRSTTAAKSQDEQTRSNYASFPAGSVRSVLRNPAAARTAFVYGEVFGKPVGLRASGSGVAE